MSKKIEPQNEIAIRYDKSEISYITQFLVSPGNEEVMFDLSSGPITNSDKTKTLPIQNRLAMPWSAVERLATILNQVIAQRQQATKSTAAPTVPQATLPRMSSKKVS